MPPKHTIIYPLGRFVLRAFCPFGRFVPWDVLSLGLNVLILFVSGRFVLGRFVCAPSSTLILWLDCAHLWLLLPLPVGDNIVENLGRLILLEKSTYERD